MLKITVLLFSLLAITANAQTATEGKPDTKFSVNLQSLQFNGDIRYRYDSTDFESATPEKKDDQKLRVRVGFTAQLVDSAKFDFRIASGTGRTSTNYTLGSNATDASGSTSIGIDRAALGLGVAENFTATLGRMGNQLVLVGGNDLVWDTDLNFDGLSLKWMPTLSEGFETTFSLSRYVIGAEGNGIQAVDLDIAQVTAKTKNMADQYILGTVSFYNYENMKGHAALPATGGTNGNTMGTGYDDDYGILDVGLEYGFNIGSELVAVFADYATNTATSSSDNTAYIAGVKVNKLKKKHDWMASYDYRQVERSSVVGAFTDSDSFGGGADGKSHRLTFAYQVTDAWYAQATAFMGEKSIASGETALDRNRYMLDVGASF